MNRDATALAVWRERRFIVNVLRRFRVPQRDAEDLAIDVVLAVLRSAARGQVVAELGQSAKVARFGMTPAEPLTVGNALPTVSACERSEPTRPLRFKRFVRTAGGPAGGTWAGPPGRHDCSTAWCSAASRRGRRPPFGGAPGAGSSRWRSMCATTPFRFAAPAAARSEKRRSRTRRALSVERLPACAVQRDPLPASPRGSRRGRVRGAYPVGTVGVEREHRRRRTCSRHEPPHAGRSHSAPWHSRATVGTLVKIRPAAAKEAAGLKTGHFSSKRATTRGQLGKLRDLRPYVFAVARRRAAGWHNARAREVLADDLGHVPSGAPSAEAVMVARAALAHVLHKLTQAETAVLLAVAEGREAREAAHVLGIPLGTVHSRLRRARRRFRRG